MSIRAQSAIDDGCRTVDWPEMYQRSTDAERYNGPRSGHWRLSEIESFVDDSCETILGYSTHPSSGVVSARAINGDLLLRLAKATANQKEKAIQKVMKQPEAPAEIVLESSASSEHGKKRRGFVVPYMERETSLPKIVKEVYSDKSLKQASTGPNKNIKADHRLPSAKRLVDMTKLRLKVEAVTDRGTTILPAKAEKVREKLPVEEQAKIPRKEAEGITIITQPAQASPGLVTQPHETSVSYKSGPRGVQHSAQQSFRAATSPVIIEGQKSRSTSKRFKRPEVKAVKTSKRLKSPPPSLPPTPPLSRTASTKAESGSPEPHPRHQRKVDVSVEVQSDIKYAARGEIVSKRSVASERPRKESEREGQRSTTSSVGRRNVPAPSIVTVEADSDLLRVHVADTSPSSSTAHRCSHRHIPSDHNPVVRSDAVRKPTIKDRWPSSSSSEPLEPAWKQDLKYITPTMSSGSSLVQGDSLSTHIYSIDSPRSGRHRVDTATWHTASLENFFSQPAVVPHDSPDQYSSSDSATSSHSQVLRSQGLAVRMHPPPSPNTARGIQTSSASALNSDQLQMTTIFAGTGWISPHPCSTIYSEVEAATSLPTKSHKPSRVISYDQWLAMRHESSSSTAEGTVNTWRSRASDDAPPKHASSTNGDRRGRRDREHARYQRPADDIVRRVDVNTPSRGPRNSKLGSLASRAGFSPDWHERDGMTHLHMPWDQT